MAAADLSQVRRAFTGLLSAAERVEGRMKALAHRRAIAVREAAKARVRVATGATKERIHVVDASAQKEFRVEVADVPGRHVMVPVWIEFGTSKMAAQPFIGPSVDESRAGYLKDAEAIVVAEAEKGLR